VLGVIWMPAVTCAMTKELSAYDMDNLGDPASRDDVEQWLAVHSGDFQSVTDFRADFHTADGEHIVHEWAKGEDSEFAFADAMYPSDDDN
jgi:hypothetical protein